jgi:hypothetical protein
MTAPYPIPIDALEQHTAILAMTGAGKTYVIRGCLEQLRRAGRRVGAIDKMGNHWGLTLSADGKGPGLEFVIFGGPRAHVPMTPADGEKIGRLFVERDIPAIFDLSLWKAPDQRRWVSDFADAVFLHNRGSLHLGMDEVQSWVPQSGRSECFEAVERLATQGRGRGVHLLMAAQRPATVDKTVLYMAQTVVAMRMVGKIDRKAVREMMEAHIEDTAAFERALPSIPTGSGFLWNPISQTHSIVTFPENTTFDSSKTPKHGDRPPAPVAISSSLVDELRKALAPPEDETTTAEKGQPKTISGNGPTWPDQREEVARLRGQVAVLSKAIEDFNDRMGGVWERWSAPVGEIMDAQNKLFGTMSEAGLRPIGRPHSVGDMTIFDLAEIRAPDGAKKRPEPRATDGELNNIANKMLANLRTVSPAKLTWKQAAMMAGNSSQSGPFYAAKKQMVAAGVVEAEGEYVWVPGGAGISRADAISIWSRSPMFKGFAVRMLLKLADEKPRSREELGADLGCSTQSGPWYRGLKDLREAGLADTGPEVRLIVPVPGETA